MIGRKHINQLEHVIADFDPSGANRYFLFGSSVRKERFRDVDLGVLGNTASRKPLPDLRDKFYDSPLPYAVDVVDFDTADTEFRDYVFQNEPIVWIN